MLQHFPGLGNLSPWYCWIICSQQGRWSCTSFLTFGNMPVLWAEYGARMSPSRGSNSPETEKHDSKCSWWRMPELIWFGWTVYWVSQMLKWSRAVVSILHFSSALKHVERFDVKWFRPFCHLMPFCHLTPFWFNNTPIFTNSKHAKESGNNTAASFWWTFIWIKKCRLTFDCIQNPRAVPGTGVMFHYFRDTSQSQKIFQKYNINHSTLKSSISMLMPWNTRKEEYLLLHNIAGGICYFFVFTPRQPQTATSTCFAGNHPAAPRG